MRISGRRGKWVVVAAWVLLIVAAAPLAGRLGGAADNDEENWLPAGAESTRALALAEREFPADRTSELVVVYARPGGVTAADRAAAERDRVELARLADGPAAAPRPSPDGEALLTAVPVASSVLEDSGRVRHLVGRARGIVADGLPRGLDAATAGAAASRADASAANGRMSGALVAVTVAVVALLMLVTYRSPLLPFVPLAGIAAGAVVAQAAAYLLAAHAGVTVSGTGEFLLTVLVFGVGTDYALLLVSRYREELGREADRHAAMARALRRSAGTIAASTATVALASLALLLAGMNSTSGLGPVIAVGAGAAMAVMLTLLPALLVVLGRPVFWPRVPRPGAGRTRPAGVWTAVAALVGRAPRRTALVSAVALAGLAAGLTVLNPGDLTGADNYTRTPPFAVGQRLVDEHFPAGSTAPAEMYAPTGSARQVADAARGVRGVASVSAAGVSASGAWARMTVVLDDGPSTHAARTAIGRLRAAAHRADGRTLVGGAAATALDTGEAMSRDLKVVPPVVLLVIAAVLGCLLRAAVAPLVLLGAVLLSTGAAAGVSALVFRAAGFPHTDRSVLTLGLLFMVAFGVDYTIFLMGRAREEAARRGHRAGVLHALAATGEVITSAGTVLAATFLVFTVSPVVLNIQLGVLVAAGVLVDALIVRSLLVPALALAAGPRLWWPFRPERGGR
jgi:RND superfamily putative drug exporter